MIDRPAGRAIVPNGATAEQFARADLDADGDADLNDAAIFQQAFGGGRRR